MYLAPRALPLALVVVLTLRSGVSGLGDAALALSLWQFLLILTEFGVSQWLLTKDDVSSGELVTCFKGRLTLSLIAVLCLCGLVAFGVLHLSWTMCLLLSIGLLLSFGQMAFAWELQRGRQARAFAFGFAEFGLPVAFVVGVSSSTWIVAVCIVSKSLIGVALTVRAMRSFPTVQASRGLSPRDFGVHYAAWALTSVASGTGELVILSGAVSAAQLGAFRLFQTIASLGSIVGAAVLPPLMARRGASRFSSGAVMAMLGLVAGVLLFVGDLIGLMFSARSEASDFDWLVFVAIALGVAAVINTMSVVPLAEVSRVRGARFAFRIGLASAAVYWSIILVLGMLGGALLAPLATLAAALVGMSGNMLALFLFRRGRL
ncbi:hypothetical protein [Gordonia jacobaea]|nr:hypothetical protein [Gordonia jacobaea]